MRTTRFHAPDYGLTLTTFALVILGLVFISSASVVLSYTEFGSNNHLLYRQMIGAALGLGVFWVVSRIDYHRYRRHATLALILTLGLLAAVVLTPLGTTHGTIAKRWLELGPISFQPTEIVKLFFIIYLAAWLERKGRGVEDFAHGFVPFAVMLAVVAGLIMLQPDLGTMSVITLSAAAMLFISGARWRHLGLGLLAGIMAVAILIRSAPYRLERLTIFLNPAQDTSGAGYHVNQALLAIGSGGLFGLGFGQSRQKYNYLPEAATDSIFAVMAEELGLVRMLLFLGVFAFLLVRGYQVASRAPDAFGRLLAVGIVSWIGFQMIINIGAMLSVFPLTGVPLPFISYGSSALVLALAAMGILVNISRQSKEEAHARVGIGRGNGRPRLAGALRPRSAPRARR
jgi:cell division protein FtsW